VFYFHGISAYRGTRHPLQQIVAAEKCLSGVEICCADRPIGPIGITVCGDVTGAFDQDCWSYVDTDGKRQSGNDHQVESALDAAIDLTDAWQIESWMKSNSKRENHEYSELFVRARAIVFIWIKPYVGNKTRKVARILARKYGVQVIEVQRYTRIWDILGSCFDYWDLAANNGWEEYA